MHININKANNQLYLVMINNSHQYQQSKQSPLSSDGQQCTPMSTKQRITSKQWWKIIPPISINQTSTSKQWRSTIHTNINKANKHLQAVMVNNAHQYQHSEHSSLNSDVQQFTPISTTRTITSTQWWSTIHININKANNHL
jgi:excinuclease UvrABC ATPase subunit